MTKSPAEIQAWLDANSHRLDLSAQYLGTEPNAARRPWDTADVRWLLAASWPYEAAAGNQSIPAVYKAIHDHDPAFLCDRFYLPATPGDMRQLERNGLGVFGIETKRPMADFDVVGTSISYPVLSMSFLKMLTMSGIPARWKDRDASHPMVLVGGLSYGAPEVLSPVVDCWFLGEAEDEPGNPGIGEVTRRISTFKRLGRWSTDRVGCYADLAREFNFLYFPRFVTVNYTLENRNPQVGPLLSKQVASYTSNLDGMRLPLRKRHVKNLDAIKPLDNPPLLYVDPSMGSGDLEAGRGCPAWSIPVDAKVEIAGKGVVRFDSVAPGDQIRCGSKYYPIAGVALHGEKTTLRVQTRQGHEIECTPEHEIQVIRNTATLTDAAKRMRGKRKALDAAPREWVAADSLAPGDYVQYFYGGTAWPDKFLPLRDIPDFSIGRPRRDGTRATHSYDSPFPDTLTPDVGWFLGAVAGDCTLKRNQVEFRVEDHAAPLADELRRAGKTLFGLEPTQVPSKFGRSAHIRFNSARLVRWLNVNFGVTPDNKTRLNVPEQIFRSPREVVARYMSAVYDANGTHLVPKLPEAVTTVRIGVHNEKFIRQVAELIRLLGLPAAIRSTDRAAIKKNGEPSVCWEVRTTAADDGEYAWLEALDPFKARFLSRHFRPPHRSGYSAGQRGLMYLQVTGVEAGRNVQVMDVDVPGPEAFNVNGVKVHNCSFCGIGWKSKPYRQHSVSYLLDYAKNLQSNMGSTRMAPFSPDLPMYTQKRQLIAGLLENVSDEVDAPSMRVDDFNSDETFVLLQVHGGMDSVTLGVEGNCLHGSTRVQLPGLGIFRVDELPGLNSAKSVVVGREVHDLDGASLTGVRWLSRVTFSDGTELLATPEHLIRIVDGKPSTTRVYLTPERRIELGTSSNYLSKRMQMDEVPDKWCAVADLEAGTVVRAYYGQLAFPAFDPEGMSADIAWLLGLLSGDGRVEKSGIEIRAEDAGVLSKSRAVLQSLGIVPGERRSSTRSSTLTAYSRHLALQLAAWGVSDTATKRRVPAAIWRSSRSVVAAYLSGVLDADGCVPERKANESLTVVHGTHDETFARELGQLVSAMGHPVSLRQSRSHGHTIWHTVIHSAPDADWSWLTFAETSRRRKMTAALERNGSRLGQPTWRGGDKGMKYVTVVKVEHDVLKDAVFDLHVPDVRAFTANGIVVHNSQRMRDLLGKGTSDEDIKESVTKGIRAGIRKFKLYMISNLPGEDEGDVYRILRLAKDLADIRDSMNQPTVRIQFSWTPLIIEGNTPMQWFAPQPASRILGDVLEEFRDLKIDSKLGAKAEPNKAHFFQLCQRASRDVGEALVDAMLDVDQACWGGVPRNFKDLIESKLRARGFANGYADCFDERDRTDMFGWEFIDTGVSTELMWRTYLQMREFAELTDSQTYDLNYDTTYHGSEWLAKCSERCYGKSCGTCDHTDLQHRNTYLRATDPEIDLSTIQSVDQHSQAVRIRARITRPEHLRFVGNDHWRYLFRRACFRATDKLGHAIAKRSIRFASDEVKYRDWTHGVDYVEFAFTRPLRDDQIAEFLVEAGNHTVDRLDIGQWRRHPVDAVTIRHDVGSIFFSVELDEQLGAVQDRLATWRYGTTPIPMRLKIEGGYFAPANELVDARSFTDDLWVLPRGHRLFLRMLVKGRPNPYNIVAALMGKQSWLPYAGHAAERIEVFIPTDRHQQDFLRPTCRTCGLGIPITLLDTPFNPDYCPRCIDENETLG